MTQCIKIQWPATSEQITEAIRGLKHPGTHVQVQTKEMEYNYWPLSAKRTLYAKRKGQKISYRHTSINPAAFIYYIQQKEKQFC